MSPAVTNKARAGQRWITPALCADALEAIGDGVLVLKHASGRGGLTILHANPAVAAMCGHSCASLIGRSLVCLHAAPDARAKLRHWLKTAHPGDILRDEGQLKCRDGSRLYAAWTYGLLPIASDQSQHLVGTYHDMSAKQRLQQDLLHAQRLEAVGRLAGDVAHDFNNLLSVINGYCEIMAGLPAVRRHASHQLAEIHQAGQKAINLVRSLLAFSRRQTLSPQVLRVDQLVQDNAEILGRLLGANKHLHLNLTAGRANIRVDPTQLQQVLLNLALNARDAIAPGGHVTIHTRLRPPAQRTAIADDGGPRGACVEIVISDNGAGMDSATLEQLFEPFFTTKDEKQGTGLGLALVYGVIQQSGGHIGVHSTLGSGTSFTVRFPQVQGEVAPLTGTPSPLPLTQGRETVLLIEENEVVRKMLAGILTADGYQVHSASTAAEASQWLDQHPASTDLVIIDPNAAYADANALIQRLHAKRPDLRVLCTNTTKPSAFPGLPSSATTGLTKPYALSALLHAARRLLDVRR